MHTRASTARDARLVEQLRVALAHSAELHARLRELLRG